MKIYNTFLGSILLTALVALLVYNAGVGDQQNQDSIPEYFVMAGFAALTGEEVTASGNAEKNKEEKQATIKNEIEIAEESKNNVFYADEWIRSWFIRFDQNDDKFISQKEFVQNIEPFPVESHHLNIFTKSEVNPDGVLNLFEFHNFIDSTKFLSRNSFAQKATPVSANTEDIDPIKFIAGALAIGLLMAAFKLV